MKFVLILSLFLIGVYKVESVNIRDKYDRKKYEYTYHLDENNDEEEEYYISDEQRLLNFLMRGYESSVRPVRNASTPVVIRMGLTFGQIFDMISSKLILTAPHRKHFGALMYCLAVDDEWYDEFMQWAPEDFNNITSLRIPCHKLWLPDIVLYNNAAEYTDGLMPANAMVNNLGNVFWPIPTKLLSSCKFDVTYFPFDEQKCKLKFGSWTYDGFQVDVVNRTSEVDLTNYVVNGEWHLVSITIIRNVVYYQCCVEPFPDVTFHIHIRRRTLYYMYNVVFPCIMMSALTLLVFCLPPDSGEKIALGITVLLAFSVFMLAVAENLPETSEFVPLISIYLTIVMGLTSVSVIMTVFVLNLHHRGPNKRELPTILRKVFLGRISDIFCGKQEHFYTKCMTTDDTKFVKNVSLRLTMDSIAHELKDDSQVENGLPEHFIDSHFGNTDTNKREHVGNCVPGEYKRKTHIPNPHISKLNDEIMQSLRRILEKHEREDREYDIIQDWRRVAQVVDRILFWVFLMGTLTSTVAILVVAPSTRNL